MENLSDAEYALMSRIRRGEIDSPWKLPEDEQRLYFSLKGRGLIDCELLSAPFVTDAGALRMSAKEEDAKKMADQKAEQDAKERAHRAQAVKDKKQDRRHDFLVAVFSVIVALCIEHIGEIVHFLKQTIEIALAH